MAPLRVLAVDDSPVIARLLQIALGGIAEVTTCSKAAAAREMGTSAEWDLAIVDLSMPHISGLELAETWRSAGASYPVVILSGYDAPGTMPPGVSAWMTKPFSPAELRSLVERLTGRASDSASALPDESTAG